MVVKSFDRTANKFLSVISPLFFSFFPSGCCCCSPFSGGYKEEKKKNGVYVCMRRIAWNKNVWATGKKQLHYLCTRTLPICSTKKKKREKKYMVSISHWALLHFPDDDCTLIFRLVSGGLQQMRIALEPAWQSNHILYHRMGCLSCIEILMSILWSWCFAFCISIYFYFFYSKKLELWRQK